MIRVAVLAAVAVGGVALSVAGASASGGGSGGCARTVTVTSDGGHRLGVQPSASRVRPGECIQFANPTQIFVTIRVGSGYAVDLPPGTLTGLPGRADYQARHGGVHVDTVTDVSPVDTLPSGSGTITVVAPVPPSPTASPTPLVASVPTTPGTVAPIAVGKPSEAPASRASRAHSREHAHEHVAGAPTPLPTVLAAEIPTPSTAHSASVAASPDAGGVSASSRRTRLVGVAVLLIVVVASALLRTQAAR